MAAHASPPVPSSKPGVSWNRLAAAWASFFAEVERSTYKCDISCYLFDPKDYLQALVHGFGRDLLDQLVPEAAFAVEVSREDAFGLHGVLGWDGTVVDVQTAFASAYDSESEWASLRWGHAQAESDARLLQALHLEYLWFEKKASEPNPQLLSIQGGSLVRVPPTTNFLGRLIYPRVRSHKEFLAAHEESIKKIVSGIRDHLHIDGANAVQMHFFDSTDEALW